MKSNQVQENWNRYTNIPIIKNLITSFEEKSKILNDWKKLGSGTIATNTGTVNIPSAILNMEQEITNLAIVIDERIANYESTKKANYITVFTILISVISTIAAAVGSFYSYKAILLGQATNRPYLAVETKVDRTNSDAHILSQSNFSNKNNVPIFITRIKNVGSIAAEGLKSQTYIVTLDGNVAMGKKTEEATTANSVSKDTEVTMIDDLLFAGTELYNDSIVAIRFSYNEPLSSEIFRQDFFYRTQVKGESMTIVYATVKEAEMVREKLKKLKYW